MDFGTLSAKAKRATKTPQRGNTTKNRPKRSDPEERRSARDRASPHERASRSEPQGTNPPSQKTTKRTEQFWRPFSVFSFSRGRLPPHGFVRRVAAQRPSQSRCRERLLFCAVGGCRAAKGICDAIVLARQVRDRISPGAPDFPPIKFTTYLGQARFALEAERKGQGSKVISQNCHADS